MGEALKTLLIVAVAVTIVTIGFRMYDKKIAGK